MKLESTGHGDVEIGTPRVDVRPDGEDSVPRNTNTKITFPIGGVTKLYDDLIKL